MVQQTLLELGKELGQGFLWRGRPGSPGFRLLVLPPARGLLLHHHES
jgi:hypothetical protein